MFRKWALKKHIHTKPKSLEYEIYETSKLDRKLFYT